MRSLKIARKMACGLAVFIQIEPATVSVIFTTLKPRNVGLWRTVNLEGAPVTQESWCHCEDLQSPCSKLPNLFYKVKIII